MRTGFEYYRAVFEDAEQNKEYAKEKLDMPILTIGGEAGLGNLTTSSISKGCKQCYRNDVTKHRTFYSRRKTKFSDKTDTFEFFK